MKKIVEAPVAAGLCYVAHMEGVRDERDWNPDWSRRGRGVATYAAIRSLGREGIADLGERTCRHARARATRIGALPGAELMPSPYLPLPDCATALNPSPT